MSTAANPSLPSPDDFGRGLTAALVLHIAVGAGIAVYALLGHLHGPRFGDNAQQAGSIEASMVSSIPLPRKADPVKDSVLTSEDTSKVPAPPPKEATQPPPRPTDILVKGKTPTKALPKPITVTPPKHPQPVPDTAKANSGDAATQLPQSIVQTKNGTATVTVQDKVFGTRYSYYLQVISRIINENLNPNEADARASVGKSSVVRFEIERDGTIENLTLKTRSGSPTLDAAVMRALQRIDTFGPLPAGDHMPIEFQYNYHQN
jgi:protein TonB